ncbi:nucleotidyltransferase domain-containing protein [Acidithiobacillus caldus]|uniref:nucleotidyltransferase domain-containing protein n=1 Tax=Acidithiobacillus caldus TaxID=33059 RepID=UPI001D033D10|nr:nucleotidyltransferase domain-containing protein [Acidithiobacillus caldus]
MTTAVRLARYEDLLSLPDNVVGEIIAGQLVTHPRPAPANARASSVLGNKVGTPFDLGEGGSRRLLDIRRAGATPEPRHPVLDLAGWRRERMPALPKTAWFKMGGLTMRLSPEQVAQIRQSAEESFGPEARVWLLGSRVDDRKLGGDLDLLVESGAPIDNPVFLAAQLSPRLQPKMHGGKVDVLILAPNLRHLPIHDIALGEGVRL